MLYVIIACVAVIVIAIVLKKQGDKSKSTKTDTKKTTAKKAASKKTSITEAESSLQSPATATEVPVPDDVRRQVENLIRSQDYSTAEALINKSLNQNAAQHGLYLFLLDIHLAQKDEFAVSQLLNHVQSLGLEQIAVQVEEKQKTAKAEAAAKRETLEFNAPVEKPKAATATANFDALVDTAPNNTSSFDDLQSSFTPSSLAKAEPEVVDQAPLDFSFTPSTPVTQEAVTVEETAPTLDFSLDSTPVETAKETAPTLDFALDSLDTPKVEEKTEASPTLDFNLDPTPATSVEKPALEFSFEPKIEESKAETANEFNFSLDTAPTPVPVIEPVVVAEEVAEFKFDLEAPQIDATPSTEALKTEPSTTDNVPSFNIETETPVETVPSFNFETEAKTETPVETVPSFSFDVAETETATPTLTEVEQPVVSLPVSDVAAFVETPAQNTTLDPVVQAFPDLLNLNEAELNIDLAQHYIDLGAYDSARQLLSDSKHLFSAEQHEMSEKLLNQMAS